MFRNSVAVFTLMILIVTISCANHSVVNQSESFTVMVDYRKPLVEMITDGKYDVVHPFITHNTTHGKYPIFKLRRDDLTKAQAKLELVSIKEPITGEQLLAEFQRQGLRPANFTELLAFGATYPEKQREFQVFALDRNLDTGRAEFLWGSISGRRGIGYSYNFTDWYGGDPYGDIRYLAVRELCFFYDRHDK